MQVGERIKFSFAGKEKEGEVVRVFPKKAYLKVDFPRHPGKILLRSIAGLEGGAAPKKKKKVKKEKVKKEKTPRAQEEKEEA